MLLTALTTPLKQQGAARGYELRRCCGRGESTTPRPSPAAAAADSRIDEGRANEGGEGAKDSHAIPPAHVGAVPTPAPCATVRAISPPCPFIRPICPVQAAGSKRGREGDEADMSTEDDLKLL